MPATRRGDELITRLLDGENDATANELLKEVFAGYPVAALRPLIYSDKQAAVAASAWLLSELGPSAAPLLADVPHLLNHRMRNARFFAIEAVLRVATIDQAPLVAQAVALILDPDEAVRRKVVQLLSRLEHDCLAATLSFLPTERLAALMRWLVELREESAGEAIVARLGDPDRATRLFAAAGAARMRDRRPAMLDVAAHSDDEEIRVFAEREAQVRWREVPGRPGVG
jgi:hypothetical protein